MFRVGIIGAGTITKRHIIGLQAIPGCEVAAVADINREAAEQRAEEFGIKDVYTDYRDLLKDDSIDAITIGTPTFVHKEIVLAAIERKKHIFCEKPVAMDAAEVKEIKAALEGTDKVFQFGMVRRYSSETAYMKKYIDSGKMGKIVCAEAVRVNRVQEKKGWFAKKALGGGVLKDEAIHHIDELLYLMGYPKILTVSAFASYINNALPVKFNGSDAVPQDTEDVIKAFVTLDNGAKLSIRTSSVLLSRRTGVYSEINGEKAGAVILPWGAPPKLEMVEVSDAYTVDEVAPELPDINPMNAQMAHFVDCCVNGAECITKIDEAVALTQLLDAIYESSETGKVVTINA